MTFADGIGAGCVCARPNKISLGAVTAQVSPRQVASAQAYILFYTRELALAAPSSPALPPPTVFGGSGHSRSGIIRGSVDRADVDHVGEGVPAQKSGGLRLFPIRPTETTLGLGKSTRNVEVAAKRGEKKDLLIGDERSLVVLEITCVCIGVCVCVYVVFTQRFPDVMIL